MGNYSRYENGNSRYSNTSRAAGTNGTLVTRRGLIVGGVVALAGVVAAGAIINAHASESTTASTDVTDTTGTTDSTVITEATSDTGLTSETTASSVSTATSSNGLLDVSGLFSDRDLEQTADTSAATSIVLADGQDVSITQEGVYVISGTAANATITVNAPQAKVQLVLDGASITNDDFAGIYVVDADKVFVTTTESDNTLSVTGAFVADGDTNVDAAIFSKTDLTLNGLGTLTVSAPQGNGITTKDDLTITGGTYDISSGSHGLQAHNSVSICDGAFTINAGVDGIHSSDSEDTTKGFVYISGGDFAITATSQGIQGTTVVVIDGGTFDITAAEGIEGTYVQINGGTLVINATDDGINATALSTSYSVVVEFNGGDTSLTIGSGDTDAVDSNGSIYVNGGTLTITTSGSSFDYDQTGQLNGGTVTVNGQQVTELTNSMMGGGGGTGTMGTMGTGRMGR
jgi:cytoskeletal protein RodZ